MKKIIITTLLLSTLLMSTLNTNVRTAFADEPGQSEVKKDNGGLEVLPQGAGTGGFFELSMSPGDSMTTQYLLKNNTDKEMEVEIERSFAWTDSNGMSVYTSPSNSGEPVYNGLLDFRKISSSEDKVVLNPNEERLVDVAITVPEGEYVGVTAGGVRFKDITVKDTDGSLVMNERYEYIIANLIRHEKADTPKLDNFKPEFKNNELSINLSNVSSEYVKNMTYDVTIIDKEGEEHIASYQGMEFTPDSTFSKLIEFENELPVGEYKVNLVVHGNINPEGDFNQEGSLYSLREEFDGVVTVNKDNKKNEGGNAVGGSESNEDTKESDSMVIEIIGILLILMFVMLIVKRGKDAIEVTDESQ